MQSNCLILRCLKLTPMYMVFLNIIMAMIKGHRQQSDSDCTCQWQCTNYSSKITTVLSHENPSTSGNQWLYHCPYTILNGLFWKLRNQVFQEITDIMTQNQ